MTFLMSIQSSITSESRSMYTIYGRIYIKESTNNEENHKLTPWGGGGEEENDFQ